MNRHVIKLIGFVVLIISLSAYGAEELKLKDKAQAEQLVSVAVMPKSLGANVKAVASFCVKQFPELKGEAEDALAVWEVRNADYLRRAQNLLDIALKAIADFDKKTVSEVTQELNLAVEQQSQATLVQFQEKYSKLDARDRKIVCDQHMRKVRYSNFDVIEAMPQVATFLTQISKD